MKLVRAAVLAVLTVAVVFPAVGCGDKTVIIVPGAGDLLENQRAAYDTNAKSLIRNAMMTVEAAYVDTRDFGEVDTDLLNASATMIVFVDADSQEAACQTASGAEAEDDTVAYYDDNAQSYALGSLSASGTVFGVVVDKSSEGGNTFLANGAETDW